MRTLKEIESIGKVEAAKLARIEAVGKRTADALKRHPSDEGLKRQRARLAKQWKAQAKVVAELRAEYSAVAATRSPRTGSAPAKPAPKQVREAAPEAPKPELSQAQLKDRLYGYKVAITELRHIAAEPKFKRVKSLQTVIERLEANAAKYEERIAKRG